MQLESAYQPTILLPRVNLHYILFKNMHLKSYVHVAKDDFVEKYNLNIYHIAEAVDAETSSVKIVIVVMQPFVNFEVRVDILSYIM